MTLVVDASVIVKWVLPEALSEQADQLRNENLVAPEFWLVEVANVVWRRCIRGEFDPAAAAGILQLLGSARIRPAPIVHDVDAALRLGLELNHPVYDCLYLACALREGCRLVTSDERFVSALAGTPYAPSVLRLGG